MIARLHIRSTTALAGIVAAALALAACGDDDSSGDEAAASGGGTATVAVETIDGAGDVLVDSDGNALYTADQEKDGKVRCTESCASIWLPLTLGNGSDPTADAEVPGTLATVKRPDGSRQVTYDGVPLYSFADDGGPGRVTGDGFSDDFDGETFSWNVVGVGAPAGADDAAAEEPSGGGGYGGY